MSLSTIETIREFFTEAEMDTIAAALEDYIAYDDPDAAGDELIGGIPVAYRVASIQSKIDALY